MKARKKKLFSYFATGLISATTIISSCPINVLATDTRNQLTEDIICGKLLSMVKKDF